MCELFGPFTLRMRIAGLYRALSRTSYLDIWRGKCLTHRQCFHHVQKIGIFRRISILRTTATNSVEGAKSKEVIEEIEEAESEKGKRAVRNGGTLQRQLCITSGLINEAVIQVTGGHETTRGKDPPNVADLMERGIIFLFMLPNSRPKR